MPLDVQADDALSAIRALRSRADVDASRIGLWGFSQGAWVAPIAASRSDDIAYQILLASTGVSPAAQMRYGTAYHLRAAGYDDGAVGRMLEARRVMEAYNRGEVSREVAQSAVDAVADEPWFPLAHIRRHLAAAPGWWPTADFDPAPVFARVRVPTLLFYGEIDEWSPIEDSITAWRRAAAVGGNRDVNIVRLPGTRHHPTYDGSDDARQISEEYTSALVTWVQRVVLGASRSPGS